ncbi:MAG: substrate-binding domain-containing protein [Anaerolineales bacterium]
MSSKIILPILLVVLVACTPAFTPKPSAPTLASIWRVQVDAELDYLSPLFNLCAQQNPAIGIVLVDEGTSSSTAVVDFFFRWGDHKIIQGHAAVLGKDSLAVIVHPDNPINGLTIEDLRSIYQNNIRKWSELDASVTFLGQIEVWRYLPEQAIQQDFETLLETPALRNPFAMLAPDPEAMRQAVSQNPTAIGFLPARWLDVSVKPLTLNNVTEEALSQPILVTYNGELDALQQSWLLCIQDVLERTTVK